MRFAGTSWVLLMTLILGCSSNSPSSTKSNAELREKLFQRFMTEMEHFAPPAVHDLGYTNMARHIFNFVIVDPTFGLSWDEIPAPTLTGPKSMVAVQGFIKKYGWNMATNDIFGEMSHRSCRNPMKPIRGLPWQAIKKREFQAVTSEGVFYVLLSGWAFNLSGVAYNPKTNHFSSRIDGFKPIGQHWYVWIAPDHPVGFTRVYEGNMP
jgi:hypothetical protein